MHQLLLVVGFIALHAVRDILEKGAKVGGLEQLVERNELEGGRASGAKFLWQSHVGQFTAGLLG